MKHCTNCQTTQGRNCACRRNAPEITAAGFWWVMLPILLVIAGATGWACWRAFQ